MRPMSTSLAWLWATFFGSGLCPVAPGTAGSISALVAAWLIVRWLGVPGWAFAVSAAVLIAPAIWAAGTLEMRFGEHDPGQVVIDEVLGQWITLAPIINWHAADWLLAFVLFRIFDIWKPFPVRRLEALPGGNGIVADDLMAGVYAALVLFTVRCFNFY